MRRADGTNYTVKIKNFRKFSLNSITTQMHLSTLYKYLTLSIRLPVPRKKQKGDELAQWGEHLTIKIKGFERRILCLAVKVEVRNR